MTSSVLRLKDDAKQIDLVFQCKYKHVTHRCDLWRVCALYGVNLKQSDPRYLDSHCTVLSPA